MCFAKHARRRHLSSSIIGETEPRLARHALARDNGAQEGAKVQIRWRLRQVMASRDIWTAKDLRELLARRGGLELSKQSISVLINKQPAQVKVETLQALCTTLKCTPNELFGIDMPRETSLADEPDIDAQEG